MIDNLGKKWLSIVKSILLIGLLAFINTLPNVYASSNVLTIEALKERYQDEIIAHRSYTAYAKQACSEGYPNIAHLFKSLSASEGIHARNFSKLLTELQVDIKSINIPEMQAIGSTRTNLKHASATERDEIDQEYPAILERIQGEANQKVITSITHAWKSEQQHRELIVKIYNAAKRWFGLLVGRIEGGESHYHICSVCGSTLTELPQHHCPICLEPVSNYREILPYPKNACVEPKRDNEW